MPPGRKKVSTYVVDEGYRARLNGFIKKQVDEGHQVYIVCPSVEEKRDDIDNASDFPLGLEQYQEKAMMTCMPSCDNFSYMMLNLVGEIGEFASKVAKDIRKSHANIDNGNLWIGLERTEDKREARNMELMHEAGDILWQLAGLCHVMRWSLEDVAKANLNKLASRSQRGVIDGEGDNR
jgi:NTP pyrophosphatase (non-canonical NTP hydrolase)